MGVQWRRASPLLNSNPFKQNEILKFNIHKSAMLVIMSSLLTWVSKYPLGVEGPGIKPNQTRSTAWKAAMLTTNTLKI